MPFTKVLSSRQAKHFWIFCPWGSELNSPSSQTGTLDKFVADEAGVSSFAQREAQGEPVATLSAVEGTKRNRKKKEERK